MTDERGSATIELALLAPVLLILLLFVAFVGRLTEARAEVDAAARDAARAASLMRTGDSAETAARQAAANTLTGDGVGCRGFSVAVDTSQFAPGGAVTAEVRCVVSLAGLSLLGLSGTRTLVSRFVAPVDRYREISGDSPHNSSARNGGDRNR
jgi:hypothetical protein